MKPQKIKIAILALSITVATALTAFSQASVGTGNTPKAAPGFTPALLQLPASTLPAGTPGTSGNTTNFYSGYEGVTGIQTNVVGSFYTNNLNGTGQGGFTTTVTNYSTNFSMVFPQVYVPQNSTVILEYRGTTSGQNTNAIFTFAQSLTGRNGFASTANQFTWSVPINQGVGANTVALDVLTNTFGYLYLTGENWQSTNGSILTNLDGGIYYAVEPNSPLTP